MIDAIVLHYILMLQIMTMRGYAVTAR